MDYNMDCGVPKQQTAKSQSRQQSIRMEKSRGRSNPRQRIKSNPISALHLRHQQIPATINQPHKILRRPTNLRENLQ
jgi:hypothetical protein